MNRSSASLKIEPDLIEEAVFLRMRAAEVATDPRFREWQRSRDALYATPDPRQRGAAFQAHARDWFVRLGLGHSLEEVLATAPHVAERVQEIHVRRAWTPKDEGSDLFGDEGLGEPLRLLLLVTPERLSRPDELRAFLQREFLHAEDMLDPAFGFRPELPEELQREPAQRELFRDRLRVLWDARVRSRTAAIERSAIEPELPAAFARAFGGTLTPDEIRALHGRVTSGELATFADFLAAARPESAPVAGA